MSPPLIIRSASGSTASRWSWESITSMASGRSAESFRIPAVWRMELGPKPATPRKTVVPARCLERNSSTSAEASGRPSHLSLSPMKIRMRTCSPSILRMATLARAARAGRRPRLRMMPLSGRFYPSARVGCARLTRRRFPGPRRLTVSTRRPSMPFNQIGAGVAPRFASHREPMAMRFGIHNSSWLDRPDPAEAFDAVKVKARWAEDHGFVWFSVMEHMIQIPRVGVPEEPVLEGWTVLAGLAAVTTRIRLATLCTAVGYRNPAHLAKIAASVDVISRGRLTLGIGAGFFEEEYRQYGWEFPPRPATRIQQMEEAVELIVKMWTEPRTTFHGRYFHVDDAILEPKPIQKPRPPVLIAGSGEQLTLRAVARVGDACNFVDLDPAEVKHKLEVLRRHCEAIGRDDDAVEVTHVQGWLLARDDAAVAAKRDRLAAQWPVGGFV